MNLFFTWRLLCLTIMFRFQMIFTLRRWLNKQSGARWNSQYGLHYNPDVINKEQSVGAQCQSAAPLPLTRLSPARTALEKNQAFCTVGCSSSLLNLECLFLWSGEDATSLVLTAANSWRAVVLLRLSMVRTFLWLYAFLMSTLSLHLLVEHFNHF